MFVLHPTFKSICLYTCHWNLVNEISTTELLGVCRPLDSPSRRTSSCPAAVGVPPSASAGRPSAHAALCPGSGSPLGKQGGKIIPSQLFHSREKIDFFHGAKKAVREGLGMRLGNYLLQAAWSTVAVSSEWCHELWHRVMSWTTMMSLTTMMSEWCHELWCQSDAMNYEAVSMIILCPPHLCSTPIKWSGDSFTRFLSPDYSYKEWRSSLWVCMRYM